MRPSLYVIIRLAQGRLLNEFLFPADEDLSDDQVEEYIENESDLEVLHIADEYLRVQRIYPKNNPEYYCCAKQDEKSARFYERTRDAWFPRVHQCQIDYRFINDHRLAFRLLNAAIAYARSPRQLFECFYRRAALYMLLLEEDGARETIRAAHAALGVVTLPPRVRNPYKTLRFSADRSIIQRMMPVWVMERRLTYRRVNTELVRSGSFPRHSLHDRGLRIEIDEGPPQRYSHKVYSDRDWNAGRLIAIEVSLCTTLATSALHTRCAHCFRESKFMLLPCANCASTMYCSTTCQRDDEPVHRYECKLSGYLMRHCDQRLLVRLLIISFTNSKCASRLLNWIVQCGYKGAWQQFNFFKMILTMKRKLPWMYQMRMVYALSEHPQLRMPTIKEGMTMARRSVYLYRVLQQRTTFVKDYFNSGQLRGFLRKIIYDMMHWSCVLSDREHWIPSSVRFTTETPPLQPATMCIFPLYSTLRHSCTPNTVAIPVAPDRMVLCTIRPIDKGEELTVDRTHGFYAHPDTAERSDPETFCYGHADELSRIFHQTCDCSLSRPWELPFPNRWSHAQNLPRSWQPGEMGELYRLRTVAVQQSFQQISPFLTQYDPRYPCVELFRAQECLRLCALRLWGPSIQCDMSVDANMELRFDEEWTVRKLQDLVLTSERRGSDESTSERARRWWHLCLGMVRCWVATKRAMNRRRQYVQHHMLQDFRGRMARRTRRPSQPDMYTVEMMEMRRDRENAERGEFQCTTEM